MANPIITIENSNILIELPLTTPTGKVRVKRRINNFGYPIATRSTQLQEKDYIEWQISYASKKGTLPFIEFSNGKIGYELSEMLCFAKKLGIIDKEDFKELHDFVNNVKQTIEESEKLTRRPTRKELYGFKRFEEKIPDIH